MSDIRMHHLKTHPCYFQPAWVGVKTFEIRLNDRGFKLNDEITLEEWDPETKDYSGREIVAHITFISAFKQKKDYCVFSFEVTWKSE